MPEATRKFVVGVSLPEEGHWCDCDLVIVDLDSALLKTIKSACEFVKKTKKGETNLSASMREVCFWDYVQAFKHQEDDQFECCIDGSVCYKEVDKDFTVSDELFERTECCILHVDNFDFHWTFYPKHSNLRLETYPISLKDVMEMD